MPTPEETLAAFGGDAVLTPPNLPDPLNAALETLRRVGAVSQAPQSPSIEAPAPGPMAPAMPGPGEMPADYAPPAPQFRYPGAPPEPLEPVGLGELEPDPVYVPMKPPATASQADKDLTDAVQGAGLSAQNAEAAQFAADQARAERKAEASQRAVDDQTKLLGEYEVARTRNNALADAETATWLHELQLQATKEANPSRWWDNQSSLGQVLWGIGMLAGAGYVALTPGAQNAALLMVTKEIDADVARQESRLQKELGALKAKGAVMEAKHLRNASDLRDTNTMKLSRIQAAERAYMARADVPGDLDAQAKKMQAKALFDQLKLPYVEKFREQKYTEKAAKEDREFQARQQSQRLGHAARLQEDEQDYAAGIGKQGQAKFARDIALKDVSATVAYRPGGPVPTDKDGKPIYSTLQSGVNAPAAGLVLKDTKTGGVANGTGEVLVDPKQQEEAGALIENANKSYTSRLRLRDLIRAKKGNWTGSAKSVLMGTDDPELRGLMDAVGFTLAKEFDPGGRITEQDKAAGQRTAMGFNADGKWLDRVKFYTSLPEIEKMLTEDINAMPKTVTESFRKYNHAEINGQGTDIVWDPNYLRGDKVAPRNAREVRGEGSIQYEDNPIKGTADYSSRRAKEAADESRRGMLLPEHDSVVVDRILDTAEGRGPKTIQAEAAKVLADLKQKHAALTATVQASRDPWSGSEATPDEVSAAAQEANRVATDIQLVEAVTKDAVTRAKETIKRFAADVTKMKKYPWLPGLGRDALRSKAKTQYKLTDAPEEVEPILDKLFGKEK